MGDVALRTRAFAQKFGDVVAGGVENDVDVILRQSLFEPLLKILDAVILDAGVDGNSFSGGRPPERADRQKAADGRDRQHCRDNENSSARIHCLPAFLRRSNGASIMML